VTRPRYRWKDIKMDLENVMGSCDLGPCGSGSHAIMAGLSSVNFPSSLKRGFHRLAAELVTSKQGI
jgi:hypothetical protein